MKKSKLTSLFAVVFVFIFMFAFAFTVTTEKALASPACCFDPLVGWGIWVGGIQGCSCHPVDCPPSGCGDCIMFCVV